jgi:aminopeptidase N
MSRPSRSTATESIRLADYAPPAFLVDAVDLVFDLRPDTTRVKSRLMIRRNPAAFDRSVPLRLDGENLELVALALDGDALGTNRYRLDSDALVIADLPDECTIDIETSIRPSSNTELSGLYVSGGNFCTQCEAEGFRRITFFPDRPDVMARYTTTILADREQYPVLLSNGNPVDRGLSAEGRHWARWEDPHPKPSYLFALVAGRLTAFEDRFVTRSGRIVSLAIWVREEDLPRCKHAMESLKAAMEWDERVFGLEYDLEIFNIVAVADFNMGAMENKSLNIFNTRYVLAAQETATDSDFRGVERVIAHEYFHNWTGNRVTCRDWFQLSLKEGLTVFRDQEFMADRHGRGAMRIEDVHVLRATQFPEDDGPLAHPVQPDSYLEINNFYTATVYNKGAELVRMIRTLIGAEAFRRGMDLYFERHDNHAVTIGDFVGAMQDASDVDLGRFRHWYVQAGTPQIEIDDAYDPATGTLRLTVTQLTAPTPGQPDKQPLLIPLAIGLLGETGEELPARAPGEPAAFAGTRILTVSEARQSFEFTDLPSRPQVSPLRGFSAPVKLKAIPPERLKILALYETDSFARWDAVQRYALDVLLDLVRDRRRGDALTLDGGLVEIIGKIIADAPADPALAAEALSLPGETRIADKMDQVDVDAIHAAREFVRTGIGAALREALLETYRGLAETGLFSIESRAMGRRALRNACLFYLGAAADAFSIELATRQFESAGNMTDVLAALHVLNNHDGPERAAALDRFQARWRDDDLVLDKWFALQAVSSLPGTLDRVEELTLHPAFDLRNPNRARALVGAFTQGNPLHFHERSGRGYGFLARKVLELDAINPQIAARMVQPLGQWRRYDAQRQGLMRAALERIIDTSALSRNTFEMASKSLG